MNSQSHPILDAGIHNTHKDPPSIMTAFDDKPLPQVGEATPKLPPLSPVETSNTPPRRRQSDKSEKEGSKMSLFSLFSRPKVEKFRGYAEPGLPLPPVQETISRAATPDPRKAKKQSFDKPYPPLPKGSPRRSSHSTSREGATRQRRGSCISPPLSQAYAQAIKASNAHTTDGAIPLQVSRNRRDSQDPSVRPERPHRNASLTSIQYSALPKKVFTLLASGHVLQYSDQGPPERQPERVLPLTLDSVACVCDLIPGEPFVLQVAQNIEARHAGLSSPIPFISRMGFRGALARKEASNMILVLRNAKELNDWMVSIRKCVQSLGGDAAWEGNKGEGVITEDEKKVENMGSREGAVEQASANHEDSAHLPALPSDSEADDTTTPREPKATPDPDEKSSGPVPVSQHKRSTSSLRLASPSSKQSVPHMETKSEDSNSATPRDSPISGPECDAASIDDQARKHFPFKIRSAIPAHLPQPKSTFFSASTSLFSSPITSPRSTLEFCDQIKFADEDDSRPESIVTDLPTIRNPRVLSRANTPTPTTTTGIEAKHKDPRLRPFHTSDPTMLRHPITKPLAFPLKVDTTMSAYDIGSKPTQANGDDSPVVKSMNTTPSSTSTRNPRRTPSVKLSLFPPPTPAPTVASKSSRVATKNVHSLRRPASLQVNSNPAPFLSSIRSSSAAATTTRQPLRKAESATSLRTAGAMANTGGKATTMRSPTSDYRFVNPNKDLAGSAFVRSRFGNSMSNTPEPPSSRSASALELKRPQSRNDSRESLTALPPPRSTPVPTSKGVLYRPRTSSRNGTRSPEVMSPGLPKLDLGLPVIGLAPPAPPPTRGLPSLPPPPQVPPKGSIGVSVH